MKPKLAASCALEKTTMPHRAEQQEVTALASACFFSKQERVTVSVLGENTSF